jgi:hypothetical protein
MMVTPSLSEMKINADCTRKKNIIMFSGYISLSYRREGRTREDITAGSLRSEKKGGETKLHTRKRDENQEE